LQFDFCKKAGVISKGFGNEALQNSIPKQERVSKTLYYRYKASIGSNKVIGEIIEVDP
jgi:hypothetical protein